MKIKSYQTRAFSIDGVDKVAEASPFISMSLSSETPVLRSFGKEILLHGPSNIDLSRADHNGLPLLVAHDDSKLPIGRLKNIRIDPDTKKLRGDAYFSARPEAQAVRDDILAEIVTDVSVGYRILGHRLERSTVENEPNSVFVTRWLPVEGSVCAIGADPNAGFGRADELDQEIDLEDEGEESTETESEKEAEKVDEEADPQLEDSSEDEENRAQPELLGSDEFRALRTVALTMKFRSESEVDSILSTAKDLESARAQLLKPPTTRTSSYKDTTMPISPEILTRGLAQSLKGDFSKMDESLAGIINQTGERSFTADLFSTRANEMTSAAKGVSTVYDQNIGFLEILRARAAVLAAGARTKVGNGSLSYIRQKAAIAATLRGENTGTTGNTFADFEKVSYIPKALTAKVYLTDELQKESILDLINVLRGDMVKQFGLAIDNFSINGNASPVISGLLSAATITAGLYNKNLGTAALPTWATVNALKAAVDTKAVDLTACNFIVTPALLGVLESTAKLTNGTAIAADGKVNGYGIISTSNMPIATLNHSMIFGDFSNMEICLQGATEFMIDVQSRFDEGITILTARQYFDVGVLQPSAFAKCDNFLVA